MRANDADRMVGRTVKVLRQINNLTQQRVAEAMVGRGHATWSRATVSEVERGNRSVSIGEWVDLAASLDAVPAALVASILED